MIVSAIFHRLSLANEFSAICLAAIYQVISSQFAQIEINSVQDFGGMTILKAIPIGLTKA
jgi:hypothetical protein